MVPPRPTRFGWYLLSRTITRCTSASGTLLALACVATMLSYCARLWAFAPGESTIAAMAASVRLSKIFIKQSLGDRDLHLPTIEITGRRCGEKTAVLRPDARADVIFPNGTTAMLNCA